MSVELQIRPTTPEVLGYQSHEALLEAQWTGILEDKLQLHESDCIQILLGENADITTGTPEGFKYGPVENISKPVGETIRVMYAGAHPGDGPDMAYAALVGMQDSEIYERIATHGEKGAELLSENVTKNLRNIETRKSADISGIDVSFLQNGFEDFPDYALLKHLEAVTEAYKNQIRTLNPNIIVSHGPHPDHPDHIAVYIANLAAVIELVQEGFYPDKNSLPAIYTTDPEFALTNGQDWAVPDITEIFPEYINRQDKNTNAYSLLPEPILYKYGSFLQDTMAQSADASITLKPHQQLNQIIENEYSLVVPQFIIDTSNLIEQDMRSLFEHQTQLNDIGAVYADMIPTLSRLRGIQIGKQWGKGINQIIIPGITATENKMAAYLPPQSMFELQKDH